MPPSIDKMKERLDKILIAKNTIAKNGLKINSKKCFFGVQEITFAGFKLANKGIMPDSSKVDAVTNAKVPTNVTEVRTFLRNSKLLSIIYTRLCRINRTLT